VNGPEEIKGYVGPKGTGKTTLAAYQIAAERRSVTYDPNNDPKLQVGRQVVSTVDGLAAALVRAGEAGPIRLCWHGFVTYGPEAFEIANRLLYVRGNVAILWDEADRYVPPGRPLPWWAGQIVNTGRHPKVGLYFTTRQPRQVNAALRANADRLCVFRTYEPADSDYLRERMAPSEGRAEFAERLRNLPDFHALDWQIATGSATVKKSLFR
jgi:hypothetical protein